MPLADAMAAMRPVPRVQNLQDLRNALTFALDLLDDDEDDFSESMSEDDGSLDQDLQMLTTNEEAQEAQQAPQCPSSTVPSSYSVAVKSNWQ